MKAIETLQNTLNNWSDGNWSKESKENIKNKEPVTMDRQSPRVLKARGPRMQQAPRVKRALKPLQPRMNQPVRLNQPIAHRTRSKNRVSVPMEQPVAHRTRSRKVAENDVVGAIVSGLLAVPVTGEETGEMLEFR